MIDERLRQWSYYYDKLTLALKSSYGIDLQEKMWYDLLIKLDNMNDLLFKVLDVRNILQDENVVSPIDTTSNLQVLLGQVDEWNNIDISDFYVDDYTNIFLDYLGNIIGLNRTFSITDTTGTHYIKLTNQQYIRCIKTKIIQNNYDGSREMCNELYSSIGLDIVQYNTVNSGVVMLYWNASQLYSNGVDSTNGYNSGFDSNDEILFKNGFYTLTSMGLSYEQTIIAFNKLGIWDNPARVWGPASTSGGVSVAVWGGNR